MQRMKNMENKKTLALENVSIPDLLNAARSQCLLRWDREARRREQLRAEGHDAPIAEYWAEKYYELGRLLMDIEKQCSDSTLYTRLVLEERPR